MNINEILFLITGLPAFAAIAYDCYIGNSIYQRIDKNKEFRSKYSGYGGENFWRDAKKIDDPKLQELICIFEKKCHRIFIVGFLITVVFFIIFAIWVK